LDGELLFTSNQTVSLVGPSPLSIHTATGLDFNDGDANDVPVVATNAVVTEAYGDFAGLLNAGAQIRDFTFATPPGGSYAVVTVGSFNFHLTSVTIDVNAPWLRLFGEGYTDAPGFDRTLGVYDLDILSSRYLNQVRSLTFFWETASGASAVASRHPQFHLRSLVLRFRNRLRDGPARPLRQRSRRLLGRQTPLPPPALSRAHHGALRFTSVHRPAGVLGPRPFRVSGRWRFPGLGRRGGGRGTFPGC
jgi:hypothetical protein